MRTFQTNYFLCLITAHMLGDYLFQSDKMAKKKLEEKNHLLLHSSIHSLISWIICGNWETWQIPVFIFISHYTIDMLKCFFGKIIYWNLVDQILHLTAISTFIFFIHPIINFNVNWVADINIDIYKYFILLNGLLIVSKGGDLIISRFLNKYQTKIKNSAGGFLSGGRIIGQLERLMIFMFIYLNDTRAIAFLITAKSILRFGDITNSETRKKVEYIIIGTFFSFSYAIITTAIVLEILKYY